jgi:hypothetical protein
MSERPFSEEQQAVTTALMQRYADLMRDTPPMSRIAHEHLIDLARIATIDEVPLGSDDLNTAIAIVNGSEADYIGPVERRRDIVLSNRMTLCTTSANGIEEFAVDSALRYLAARPAATEA